MKVFATGLAVGILLDAVAVRALLLPALMALLDRWNWWLPAWAQRCLFPLARRQPPPPGRQVTAQVKPHEFKQT